MGRLGTGLLDSDASLVKKYSSRDNYIGIILNRIEAVKASFS